MYICFTKHGDKYLVDLLYTIVEKEACCIPISVKQGGNVFQYIGFMLFELG